MNKSFLNLKYEFNTSNNNKYKIKLIKNNIIYI